MSRTTAGLAGAAILVLAAIAYWVLQPKPGPGHLVVVTATISYDSTSGACSINPMPVVINSDEQVSWSISPAGTPFTVTFPSGWAFNPGTPFLDPRLGRVGTFSSSQPTTPPAVRTAWQDLWSEHDFPIRTITVNVSGAVQTCYDASRGANPDMKVHVN
jgi:hypothetical protein